MPKMNVYSNLSLFHVKYVQNLYIRWKSFGKNQIYRIKSLMHGLRN